MNIKYYIPVLLIIFLSACTTDDGGGLGSDNASDQINAIAGELNDDVVTLVQSDGVDGVISLIDLINSSEEPGRVSPYQTAENRALIVINTNQTKGKMKVKLIRDKHNIFTAIPA